MQNILERNYGISVKQITFNCLSKVIQRGRNYSQLDFHEVLVNTRGDICIFHNNTDFKFVVFPSRNFRA